MTDRRWRPEMTESRSTGLRDSLPFFLLTALLYIARSRACIVVRTIFDPHKNPDISTDPEHPSG